MKKYNVFYSEPWKQVLAMIMVPLAVIFPLVFLSLQLPRDTPEWVTLAIIFGGMALAVVFLLLIIFYLLTVPCELGVSEKGIVIKLLKTNLFFSTREIETGWNNVANASQNFMSQNDRYYYLIRLKKPKKSFQLTLKGEEAKIADPEFWLELDKNISSFNAMVAENSVMKITKTRFYDGPFAKILTALATLAMVVAPFIAMIRGNSHDWWRVLYVYALGSGWVINYYLSKRKKS